MTVEEFDLALTDLETRVDRLRALYENWFRGYEKTEPAVPRKDVERRVYALRKELPRNTALRFRYNQLYLKYTTLSNYWQRTARQIEEGTYRLHLQRLKRKHERHQRADGLERDEDERRDDQREVPRGYELDLDESLNVDDLLDELEIEEVARALERPGPHSEPPAPTKQHARPPAAAPATATFGKSQHTANSPSAGRPVAQVGAKPAAPAAEPKLPEAPRPAPAAAQPGLPPMAARPAAPLPQPAAQAGLPPAPRPAPAPAPARSGATAPGTGLQGNPSRPAPLASPSIPGVTLPVPAQKPQPLAPAAARPALTTPGLSAPKVASPAAREASFLAPAAPASPQPGTQAPRPAPAAAAAPPPRPAAPPPAARPAAPAPGAPVAPGGTTLGRPAPVSPAMAAQRAPAQTGGTFVGRPPTASPLPDAAAPDEQRLKRIYDEYSAARRRNNEGDVRYEALVTSIQKMLPELSKKHQGKRIDFEVVVKDGRVGLKPKAT